MKNRNVVDATVNLLTAIAEANGSTLSAIAPEMLDNLDTSRDDDTFVALTLGPAGSGPTATLDIETHAELCRRLKNEAGPRLTFVGTEAN